MDYSNIQMVIAQSNAYDLLGHLQPDILKFIVSFSVFFHLNLDFFLQKQHNETFPTAQQQRMIDIRRQVDDVRQVIRGNYRFFKNQISVISGDGGQCRANYGARGASGEYGKSNGSAENLG